MISIRPSRASSQNGLTYTLRLKASTGCSANSWGIFLWIASNFSTSGATQVPPFSMVAMRRSGNRVKAPWHTMAVIMSLTARFCITSRRSGLGLNGRNSVRPSHTDTRSA